jgi:hypothetical protein
VALSPPFLLCFRSFLSSSFSFISSYNHILSSHMHGCHHSSCAPHYRARIFMSLIAYLIMALLDHLVMCCFCSFLFLSLSFISSYNHILSSHMHGCHHSSCAPHYRARIFMSLIAYLIMALRMLHSWCKMFCMFEKKNMWLISILLLRRHEGR